MPPRLAGGRREEGLAEYTTYSERNSGWEGAGAEAGAGSVRAEREATGEGMSGERGARLVGVERLAVRIT